MVIDFSQVDLNNPVFVLENMDETPIGALGFAHSISAELNYNEVSTLEFICPKKANEIDVPYYDDIDIMKVVLWKNVGRFLIVDINETNEGFPYKTCKCYSLEFSFTYKTFYLAKSTYCLYNPIISGTIMDYVLESMPEWTVSYCSNDLLNKYRTFDTEANTNIYNFLKDIQKKYGCIFDFDTLNKTIKIFSINEIVPTKPIYLSLNNLLKTVEVNQRLDDIFTVVSVYGANNLSINSCNPMGSKLYDLSYYATDKFMAPTLIQKYNNWKSNYDASKANYNILNIQSALQISRQVVENAKLNTLKGELSALTTVQSTLISAIAGGDTSLQSALDAKNAEISAKKSEIVAQESLLTSIQAEINNIKANLQAIVNSVQFNNFFSPAELNVLQRFFKEDTLTDNSFVAQTTNSYNDINSSNVITNFNINLANATVTEITSVTNKLIYSVAGGIINSSSTPSLNANVIRMTLERNTINNNFILSAYLSSGTFNGTPFANSACISITGNCSNVAATSSSLSFAVTGNLYFTQSALSAFSNNAVAQDLMEYGETCLRSLSRPSYEFEIEAVNFITISEFESFKNQLGLGQKVYIDLDNGMGILEPFVISVRINFDQPNDFKLIFSDKYCQSGVFSLTSLLEESINMGSKLSLNQYLYNSFIDSGAQTALTELQQNALDLSKKAILSASGIAPTIDDSGLHLRKSNGMGGFEPEEIAMINNQICFTKDNFNTVALALGKINFNGTELYGLVADAIVGKIIAGNSLTIESAKTSGGQAVFKVDGDGAVLHNAKFDLVTANSHILLDPTLGFGIGTYPLVSNGTWNTNNAKFYINSLGDVVFKGKLSGATGVFSGIVQASDFQDLNGNSMLTADHKFASNYLELKGISITDSLGRISFAVEQNGIVKLGNGNNAIMVINGKVLFGQDVSLNWNHIANKPSLATEDMLNDIVNGNYSGGTFIDGSMIYSPTLVGATIYWGNNGVYGSLTRGSGYDGNNTTNVVLLTSASSIVLDSTQNIRLTAQKMWFDVDSSFLNIKYNGSFYSLPNLIQALTPAAVFA